MPQPVWRKIVSEMQIPQVQGTPWTVVLEYLTPGKLMKIEVVIDNNRNPPVTGTWTPQDYPTACPADGDFTGAARGNNPEHGTPLVSSAPVGALIGRIGGSTADQNFDTGTNPARIGFAVGRMCIFTVPATPTGALFLGINDAPARMVGVQGWLLVNVYEGL